MPKMIRPNLKEKIKKQKTDLLMQIKLTNKWITETKDPDHLNDLREYLWRLTQQVRN